MAVRMTDQATAAEPRSTRDRDRANDQRDADADQTAADADQTASDADQTASERDDADASLDQRSADRDQASADANRAGRPDDAQDTYESTRAERTATRVDRIATRVSRSDSATARHVSATARDRGGSFRDATASRRTGRDDVVAHTPSPQERVLMAELESLRQRAATDRARAAADRERAARDRAASAAERSRLQKALLSAHVDDLTGAFRREMGWQALALEIDRSRRGDGRFVLAFIDVDGLKVVNDRSGHAAGDEVLKTLVSTMRSSLRSFDPIVRYGGDEFVCGVGGVAVADVRQRFEEIGHRLQADTGVGISVGLAVLGDGDGLDEIVARADSDLLEGRGSRAR